MPTTTPRPRSPVAKKAAPARVGRPRKLAASAPAPLGRGRILQAALAAIDAKGLAAFNIRELAAALGVAPAAIYWHVPSRDALVSGAIAIAMQDVARGLESGPWQNRLRALLVRFRDALRQHPHLAPAVANEMAYNAAFDAPMLDHIVRLLEDARFTGEGLVDAYNVVLAGMCGFATLELSSLPCGPRRAFEDACRAQIATIDPDRHAALARHLPKLRDRAFLLRWSHGTESPLATSFDAWIDVLLRGLASRSKALRRA